MVRSAKITSAVVWGLVLLTSELCSGQTQRIGIPSGTFTVKPNGRQGIDGYCMDEHLPAPKAGVSLNNILISQENAHVKIGNGATMGLKDALEKGLLKVEAREVRLAAIYTRSAREATEAGKKEVALLLGNLAERVDGKSPSEVKKIIDDLAHEKGLDRALSFLDKLAERVNGKSPKEIEKVISDMAQVSKELDRAQALLWAKEAAARTPGAGDGQGIVLINNSGEQIEVTFGKPTVFSDQVRKADDVAIDHIKSYTSDKQYGRQQDEVWLANEFRLAMEARSFDAFRKERRPMRILAYQRQGEMDRYLVRTEDGVELRVMRGSDTVGTIKGPQAIDILDSRTKELVAEKSTPKVQFVHLSPRTEAVRAEAGDGGGNGSGGANNRGGRNGNGQGDGNGSGGNDRGGERGGNGSGGKNGGGGGGNNGNGQGGGNGSDGNGGGGGGDGYFRLRVGSREFLMDDAKIRILLEGNSAKDKKIKDLDEFLGTEKDTKFVIYRDVFDRGNDVRGVLDPFARIEAYDPDRIHLDGVDVIKALEARYGERNQFFLDDDMDKARTRVENQPSVRGPKDLALISDKKSFPDVKDHGLVESAEVALRAANVQVITDLSTPAGKRPIQIDESNLIVLSGHKDDAFRTYVKDLDNRGLFRDKFVVLFSCYADGDAAFNSELMNTSSAKGVLFYTQEINAQAVSEVLIQLSRRLNRNGNPDAVHLKQLLNEAVDQAVRMNPDRQMKEEIKKMRQGVIQVSWLVSPLNGQDKFTVLLPT